MSSRGLESAPPNILVLGGTGSVGRKVSRALVELGHQVLVASRDLHRAGEVARKIPGAVPAETRDLRRPSLPPPEGAGFVVNCTGEEDPAIATAWTTHGWGFVDITATSRYCSDLARLAPAPAPVVAGVGLMPGLAGLIAADLARADPGATRITLSCLLGLADDHGVASSQWTIGGLGRSVGAGEDGFRNFSDAAVIEFPGGFGRRRAWRYDFADRVMLPGRIKMQVSTRCCFASRLAGEAMATASAIPGASSALLKLAPFFERSQRGTDWWALVARTGTGRRIGAVGRS